MWSLDKKSFLEYLGKNPKDVRWIDRAVKKGIVWKDEDTGAYILCTEYIEELMEENLRLGIQSGEVEGYRWMKDGEPALGVWEKRYNDLKTEYDKLKEEYDKLNKSDKVDKNDNRTISDSELLDHLSFLYMVNDDKLNALNNLTKMYYDRNPADGWENAEKKVRESLKRTENPDEKDELEYIKDILTGN